MALEHNSVSDSYKSSFVSTWEMIDPAVSEIIRKPYGNQGKEYETLRKLGYESPVETDVWYVFEKDKTHTSFKVTGNTAEGNAGAEVEITIHADSIDANGKFYPRQNDVILHKGKTAVQTVVSSVNESTGKIKLKPVKTGGKVPAIATGETLAIVSGVFGEGSGVPRPAITRFTKYTHQAQIVKEAVMTTGTTLVTKTLFPVLNSSGEAQGLYSEAFIDGEMRLMKKIEGMLMVSQKNTAATANTDPIAVNNEYTGGQLTSTSLMEAAQTRGTSKTYGTWATPLSDFDTLTAHFLTQYVPVGTTIWGSLGASAHNVLTNGLVTLFDKEDSQYVGKVASAFGISQEAAVDYRKFSKGGYTFAFDVNFALSNPDTMSATGYAYNEYGFLIPLKTSKATIGENRQIPNFGIRYRKMGAYDRRFNMDTLSGFGSTYGGKQPVHEGDFTKAVWMTHLGAEFAEANSLVFLSAS